MPLKKEGSGAEVFVGLVVIVLLLISVIPFFFMVAWNSVVPALFGLAAINFGQSFWLVIGSHILFGGIGRGSSK